MSKLEPTTQHQEEQGLLSTHSKSSEDVQACAFASMLHINASLHREVEACIQAAQAAEGDVDVWRRQNLWLRRQLIAARRATAMQRRRGREQEQQLLGQNGGGCVGEQQQQQQQQGNRTAEGVEDGVNEAALLEELGRRAEAEAASAAKAASEQPLTWQPCPGYQKLLGALIARGKAAGWLISPSEVQQGRVLGQGAFGISYEGRWRGARVAVKCVRVSQATEQISFLREVEALSSLRHPHILPFLGACMLDAEHFWLVTEFMEQGTLANWLHPKREKADQQQFALKSPQAQYLSKSGPPGSLLDRFRLAYEVAQGMEALESLQPPLMHRDLKPSNVFIDGAGHARVADFGLARRLTPEIQAELTGETGTYLYMAPEVMRHEIYSTKADVWSWGVLLVEALSLQLPYAHTFCTPAQIAMSVCEEKLSPSIPSDVPVGMQVIAQLALSFDPDQRPNFQLLNSEMGPLMEQFVKNGVEQPDGVVGALTRQLATSWTSMLKGVYPLFNKCM